MNASSNRPLKIAGMILLVLASLVVFTVLVVLGFRYYPYITLPLLVALLVWGLLRAYNLLMRHAEEAYLESRAAKQRAAERRLAERDARVARTEDSQEGTDEDDR